MFPYFLLAKASLDVHDATAVFLVISILNGIEVRSGRCVFPGCTVQEKGTKKKKTRTDFADSIIGEQIA